MVFAPSKSSFHFISLFNSVPARATTATWKPDSMAWRKDWIVVVACEWRWQSLLYLCMLMHRISRFSLFSFSTVPAQPGYLNNGLAERFDPGRCSWMALTIVALSLPLPCIDFQYFYDFILDCTGPSRKWMTRKPDESNKTLKSSSSSLNSFSHL